MPRFKSMTIARLLVGALAVSVLPALAGQLSFPNLNVRLLELGDKALRVGSDLSADELARIQPGMPVVELEDILGRPVVRETQGEYEYLDYNINIPMAEGSS